MMNLCFILLTTISVPENIQSARPNMLVNVTNIVEIVAGVNTRLVITNEGNERGSWSVKETLDDIIKKINACK